jgi:hypothetical protein
MTAPITRGELHEALDTWAGAIMAMLTSLDTRLCSVDTRLTSVETRLTGVETRLTGVETRLTGVETRGEEVHGRLVLVESRVGDIPALIRNTEETILAFAQSMLEPQRTVPERLGNLEEAALPDRVGKLEAKVFAPKRRASKTGRRARRPR